MTYRAIINAIMILGMRGVPSYVKLNTALYYCAVPFLIKHYTVLLCYFMLNYIQLSIQYDCAISEQEDTLVALIPLNDDRLKPSRT